LNIKPINSATNGGLKNQSNRARAKTETAAPKGDNKKKRTRRAQTGRNREIKKTPNLKIDAETRAEI
jgi:hypothetical protein